MHSTRAHLIGFQIGLLVVLIQLLTIYTNRLHTIPVDFLSDHTSFNIAVKVNIVELSTKTSYKFHLEQTYSSVYHQSKTKYRCDSSSAISYIKKNDLSEKGIIHTIDKWALKLDETTLSCSTYPLEAAQNFLLPKRRIPDNEDLYDSVVGPLRLLMLLNRKRDDLVPTGQTYNKYRSITVNTYSYNNGVFNVILQFSAQTKSYLPVKIEVQEKDYQYNYEFVAIDIPEVAGKVDTLSWTTNDSPILDQVTIDPVFQCQTDKTISLDRRDFSFSFQASAQLADQKEFVEFSTSYTTALGTLRIDRSASKLMPVPLSMIMNLFHGYQYIVPFEQQNSLSDDYRHINYNYEHQNERPCLMFKSASSTKVSSLSKAQQFLFGSDTVLNFLGYAQVRGIKTRVYEGLGRAWPTWFKYPFYFSNKGSSNEINSQAFGLLERGLNLVVVIYIKDDCFKQITGDDYSGVQLAHIDLYRVGKLSKAFIDRTSIQISNFQWSIPLKSAENQRVEDMFSLVDLCPPPNMQSDHYAQVSLMMTTTKPVQAADWITSVNKRNFAILSELQSKFLQIPVTMISDLESRLIFLNNREHTDEKSHLKLAISFRMAKEALDLTELTLLGQGQEDSKIEDKMQAFYHLDLEQCIYMAASSLLSDSYMAYNGFTGQCLVGKDGLDRNDEVLFKSLLRDNLSPPGDLHVFKISHKPSLDDKIVRLVHGTKRSNYFARNYLVTLTDGQASNSIIFGDLKMELHELDEKNIYQLDQQRQDDTNKFMGFGLVATDAQNRLVSSETLEPTSFTVANSNVAELTEVTYGQCQAACLADFDCKSYSVCLQLGGQLECILSKVNFRDPLAVINLMDLQLKRLAYDEQVQLDMLELGSIKVRKNPHCELHNKIYLNLFEHLSNHLLIKFDRKHLIYPVNGRESCARYCFEQTLEVLRDDSRSKHQISVDSIRNPTSDSISISEAIKEHKQSSLDFCEFFYYLDATKLVTMNEQVKNFFKTHLARPNSHPVITGYCFIRSKRQVEGPESEESNMMIDVNMGTGLEAERHYLNMNVFFEKKFGIRLISSPLKNTEEIQAFHDADRNMFAVTRRQFELLRSFVDRGDNNQNLIANHYNIADCARACLTQTAGTWPACKSFSVVITGSELHKTMYCYANSITLAEAIQAERFDLCDENPEPGTKYFHYDPRPGFITVKLNEEKHLWLAASGLIESVVFGLHTFGVLLIVLIAKIAGFMLGIKLGLAYMDRSAKKNESLIMQAEDGNDTMANGQRPTVEFKNLVNFEGVIDGDEQQAAP